MHEPSYLEKFFQDRENSQEAIHQEFDTYYQELLAYWKTFLEILQSNKSNPEKIAALQKLKEEQKRLCTKRKNLEENRQELFDITNKASESLLDQVKNKSTN